MVREKGYFPNYLMNDPQQERRNRRDRQAQPSSFVASDMHGVAPSVPFLKEHKNSFQRYQKENPQMRIRKDYISEERLRQREERREQMARAHAFYQSRRPYRATEIPSVWNSNPRAEAKGELDYRTIKEQLRIADDDLILIDLDPPTETKEVEKKIPASNKKTNKALHRSLGLIMEQEQTNLWSNRKNVPKKPVVSGVKSFFDEMNGN